MNKFNKHFFSISLILIFSISGNLLAGGNFTYSEFRQMIPGPYLPENVFPLDANNNLDAFCYENHYYLAFRTAPSHFASDKVKMYIIRSKDNINWSFEDSIVMHTDLRECRFFELKGELFMCFFEAGDKWNKFEPRHMHMGKRISAGEWNWSQLEGMDGFVPWRVRVRKDTAYMSAYNGIGLYSSAHPGDLRLFWSTDAYTWKPISEKPQVTLPNAEEGAFVFDQEGNIWANIRMEGDGSAVAFAKKGDYANWKVKVCDYKYDSALLFESFGEIYMIARRNLDGAFNKAPKFFPDNLRRIYNLIRYSLTKKVTALFKLDKEAMTWSALLDFPSTGDNAFPGLIQISDTEWYIYNYSSDIHGAAKNWIKGQLSKTFIYTSKLTYHL